MLFLYFLQLISAQNQTSEFNSTEEYESEMKQKYKFCTNPTGPEIRCDLVPIEYQECKPPNFRSKMTISNDTNPFETCIIEGSGKQYHELVKQVYVNCTVLTDVDCCGDRTFYKKVPCVRHQIQDDGKCVYSYPTSVILSIFLGITGGDRFYLGHTASAIGKLFTLGGLGVWWIVDIVLLLTGQLMPKEGYSWCNNY